MERALPDARANFIVLQSSLDSLAADVLWQNRADQVAFEVWTRAVEKPGGEGGACLPDTATTARPH